MALGICAPGMHRHETVTPGCTYPSNRTKTGACGRSRVRAYLDGNGGVAYRCETHDTEAAREAAAKLGFRVVNTDTKAERIEAVNRAVAAQS